MWQGMLSEPSNIFEAAGKAARKEALFREKEEKKRLSFDEMFKRCMKLHEELQTSVGTLLSKHGVKSSQYQEYIAKPENFSEEEWDRLEEQKRRNEQMLIELRKQAGAQISKKEEETKQRPKKLKVPPRRRWLEAH